MLGGSWFVGRAVVAKAVERGHDVTVFNRGVSQVMVPGSIRHVVGNREILADLRGLAGRDRGTSSSTWPAVFSPSCSVARRRSPTSPSVELIWADEDWLIGRGTAQWTELPLWRNAAAAWAMNTDSAHDAGLERRPLAETAAGTWAWCVPAVERWRVSGSRMMAWQPIGRRCSCGGGLPRILAQPTARYRQRFDERPVDRRIPAGDVARRGPVSGADEETERGGVAYPGLEDDLLGAPADGLVLEPLQQERSGATTAHRR